jgi:hypothetical protein
LKHLACFFVLYSDFSTSESKHDFIKRDNNMWEPLVSSLISLFSSLLLGSGFSCRFCIYFLFVLISLVIGIRWCLDFILLAWT